MRLFSKFSTISALLVLLTFSTASQAVVVDSGFKTASWADFGVLALNPGSYTLDLTAFTFGPAGPTVFGIANSTEAFQVAVASFGTASTAFTTVGGNFNWLTGGFVGVGAGTGFVASVNVVPLPSSVIMIGSALAAMVSIGRRGASRRARA